MTLRVAAAWRVCADVYDKMPTYRGSRERGGGILPPAPLVMRD